MMESAIPLVGYANAPTAKFCRKSDRSYEGDYKTAIALTLEFSQKGDRTTPEFNKRSDRLDKGEYKTAIALTLEFSQKGDRTDKSYENFNF